MYDTIELKLTTPDPLSTDYLKYVPRYVELDTEHIYPNGTVLTGNLDGLVVSVTKHSVCIKKGSVCKWFLGDNVKVMTRQDTRQAIEKLSNILHLPMDCARVTRMDIAQNIITKHPIEVYLNHLGVLWKAKRAPMDNGLYYYKGKITICFYDKIKELKARKESIPELYTGRNVLRYEQRYMGRLSSIFGIDVTGATLYDEVFYIHVINKWLEMYEQIDKINNANFNLKAMTTITDFKNMGLLALIMQMGGEVEFYNQINEARLRGELTSKQVHDIRNAILKANKFKDDLVIENDAIAELNSKIRDIVKFYR